MIQHPRKYFQTCVLIKNNNKHLELAWNIWYFLVLFLNCLFWHIVDSYGLENDDFNTEELDEAVADIQDTLEADNYEDQLPQPEVNILAI